MLTVDLGLIFSPKNKETKMQIKQKFSFSSKSQLPVTLVVT